MSGVALTSVQQNALTYGRAARELTEKGRYLSDDYYDFEGRYAPVRLGLFDIWLCGYCCAGGCSGRGDRDGRATLILAAIAAIFFSIVTLFYSIASAQKAGECNRKAAEGQIALTTSDVKADAASQRIYTASQIIFSTAAKERTTACLSQFMMASGLAMLTVALVVAAMMEGRVIPSYVVDLGIYGGAAAGGGLLLYGASQLYRKIEWEPKMQAAYDTMAKDLANLEATVKSPDEQVNILIVQGTTLVVYQGIVLVIVQQPAQPSGPPPAYAPLP